MMNKQFIQLSDLMYICGLIPIKVNDDLLVHRTMLCEAMGRTLSYVFIVFSFKTIHYFCLINGSDTFNHNDTLK